MNSPLNEFTAILLGIASLILIFIIFIGLFNLAAWIDPRLAYGIGTVYWVAVAIAFANEHARR